MAFIPSRSFNGSTDYITLDVGGSTGELFTAYTWCFWVYVDDWTAADIQTLMLGRTSGFNKSGNVAINTGGTIFVDDGDGYHEGPTLSTVGWYKIVITNGTGSIRFHVLPDGGSWTHSAETAFVSNSVPAIGASGVWNMGGGQFNDLNFGGDIAVVAFDDVDTNDAGVEALVTLADLAGFKHVWTPGLDNPVTDDGTDGGADESAISGTTAGADSPWDQSGAATEPDDPISVTARPHDGFAVVEWPVPADGGSAITDYTIQYAVESGTPSWSTFTDGTSTNHWAKVTGLTNGTSYIFRVLATNAIGSSGYSSASPAVTPRAPTPTAPFAEGSGIAFWDDHLIQSAQLGVSQIALRWVIIQEDFTAVPSLIRVYSGSQWGPKALKKYNGSAWVEVSLAVF